MNVFVSVSPHIKSEENIQKVMRDVLIALSPAAIMSVWFYKSSALLLILTCIASCCLAEYVSQKVMKRGNTLSNLSAVVTGLLLAFCLPSSIPLWIAAVGCIFSIVMGKEIFGGLGHNPLNPALLGRAFLQISWPKDTSLWVAPYDGLTTATPLSITKLSLEGIIPGNWTLFWGNFQAV